jgi:hypothetical protein
MPEILTYKTYTISNVFGNNETTFTKDIFVDFEPDEIVLKYLAYSDDNTALEGGMYSLKCDMFNTEGNVLINFPADSNFAETLDIPFKNNSKNLNGTRTFSISKLNNGAIEEVATMDLSISFTLLFVKFKSN